MKSIAAFCGSLFAFLAVAIGAFGAHYLKTRLSEESLKVFQTGVQYQVFHALALLLVSILFEKDAASLKLITILFVFGIILFAGSLYALAITEIKPLGAITPFGGLCFLAGWVVCMKAALKS